MSSTDKSLGMSPQQVQKNKLKLIGIFAVALLPLLIAVAMYFGGFALPSSKTNKGDLIWPPLDLSLYGNTTSSPFALVESDKKWFLMLAGNGECSSVCQEKLHLLRQVNIALGREMERVGRVLVLTPEYSLAADLAESYPNLSSANMSLNSLEKLFNDSGVEAGSAGHWKVWIVDPLGNVLLGYPDASSGYDMIDDLKKLLKLSNIG